MTELLDPLSVKVSDVSVFSSSSSSLAITYVNVYPNSAKQLFWHVRIIGLCTDVVMATDTSKWEKRPELEYFSSR